MERQVESTNLVTLYPIISAFLLYHLAHGKLTYLNRPLMLVYRALRGHDRWPLTDEFGMGDHMLTLADQLGVPGKVVFLSWHCKFSTGLYRKEPVGLGLVF